MAIVNFLGSFNSFPDGSVERNTAFVISHCGFFLLNLCNAAFLILIEGFVTGRLPKGLLSKLTLLGCIAQVFSCVASITRYNIMQEYHPFYGKLGVYLSLVSFGITNYVMSRVLFPRNRTLIRMTLVILLVCMLVIAVEMERNWEISNFYYFRFFVMFCIFFQTICSSRGLHALKGGSINMKAGITEVDRSIRIFVTAIILQCASLIAMIAKRVIFAYPGTGISFCAVVLLAPYLDRMDFMNEVGEGSAEENQPLSIENEV